MRSTLLSAAAAGVAIGVVATLAFLGPRAREDRVVTIVPAPAPAPARGTARAAATDAAAPEPTAAEALFDRNRAMPADPDLAAEYEDINDRYFSHVLPAPQTRWETGLGELGSAIADRFVVQGLTDGHVILINPSVEHDPDQRRRALCHEMVHLAVWGQDAGHGPLFQERLRQLSLRGAFKGIAATDEERASLAETLRRKRAGIEAEEHSLLADRDTLDRSSEAAVDAFNARVRAQQVAVADYNALVAQYNLMVSYPDGLAAERLKPRADGTVAPR